MENKIYPYIVKNIFLPVCDFSMKTKIKYYYDKILTMQNWTNDEIKNWQNLKLNNIITHAYENTEYYHSLFNKCEISPKDIKSIDDLDKIPVLTKDIVRNNQNQLVPKNVKKIPYIKSSTGGSTGDPLKFLSDKRSWSFLNASNIINWEKFGYKYGNKFIALGSTSLHVDESISLKHKLYYKMKQKIPLNGINMSESVCEKYLNIIKTRKVKYIYGYASSIFLLAKYALEKNIKVDIKTCFTTSEILTNIYRDTIEDAFKCNILNCYGARDGGITAFELEKGFFEVAYNSIIRFKDLDSNNTGKVLITDLYNYAMPLINYQVGDELMINKKASKNKSNGQYFNDIIGRTSDILRLENGRVLTGPGFTILFKDLPVEAYRIEKDGPNSVVCKVKKLPEFSIIDENLIISTMKKQLGSNSKFCINYVDSFPKTKSGKKNYFIAK